MKYLFTLTAQVDIEAENIAQAYKHLKRIGLISRLSEGTTDRMSSGRSWFKNNKQSVRHVVKQRGPIRARLEEVT